MTKYSFKDKITLVLVEALFKKFRIKATEHYWRLNGSYAQEGEDLILKRHFGTLKRGFYVDVGAYKPIEWSNTYQFYRNGWNGINIDATPASMEAFKAIRPKDINIECPVSDTVETLTFNIFDVGALNTFSNTLADQAQDQIKNAQQVQLQTRTLESLLNEHLPPSQKIQFLSVDVEGHDLRVLRSNNWKKYRPEIVLVEELKNSLKTINQSAIYQYMEQQDYHLFAKTINTLFFRDNKV